MRKKEKNKKLTQCEQKVVASRHGRRLADARLVLLFKVRFDIGNGSHHGVQVRALQAQVVFGNEDEMRFAQRLCKRLKKSHLQLLPHLILHEALVVAPDHNVLALVVCDGL
jgi:hypothetical protein